MSRELKFRARYHDQFVYFDLRQGLTKEGLKIYRELVVNGAHFQQFTGLFDFDGEQIFEGDILSMKCVSPKREGESFNNYVDFFAGGTFCGFRLRGKKSFFEKLTFNRIINGQMKVIGNIYETPELLKP